MNNYDGSFVLDENRRLRQLLTLERQEHVATRRRLAKAEHDRDRYKRRIRFLDGRHEILSREYRALNTVNRSLIHTVQVLEGRLLCEQTGAQGAEKEPGGAAGI